MKRPIAVLYRDQTYRYFSFNQLKGQDLSSPRIEMIMIPLEDHPNLYFPIRPSTLYEFSYVDVHIEHRILTYDFESCLSEDLFDGNYDRRCVNIVEFGNALFNLYKFRGASIFLAEYMETEITTNFTNYPTRIQIDFYDERKELVESIDSGDMGSMSIEDTLDGYEVTPPQYQTEHRLECLDDILFIPKSEIYHPSENEGLGKILNLHDSHHWKIVENYQRDVRSGDFLLVSMKDFCAYYFIDADSYSMLDDDQTLKRALIEFCCCPICTEEDQKYIQFREKHQKPSSQDKLTWIRDIGNGDLFLPMRIICDITSAGEYLTVYAFVETVSRYLEYFLTMSYFNENPKCLSFIVFGRKGSATVLEASEYSRDRLATCFLKILNM